MKLVRSWSQTDRERCQNFALQLLILVAIEIGHRRQRAAVASVRLFSATCQRHAFYACISQAPRPCPYPLMRRRDAHSSHITCSGSAPNGAFQCRNHLQSTRRKQFHPLVCVSAGGGGGNAPGRRRPEQIRRRCSRRSEREWRNACETGLWPSESQHTHCSHS